MSRLTLLTLLLAAGGCFEDAPLLYAIDTDEEPDTDGGDHSATTTGGTTTDPDSGTSDTTTSAPTGDDPDPTGDDDTGPDPCEGDTCQCAAPAHAPCDAGTDDPFAAIGVGCDEGPGLITQVRGSPDAIGVRTGFGPSNTWAPREGAAFAVIGTGNVADLDMPTPAGDDDVGPTHCNDDLGTDYDVGDALPNPLQAQDVTGDCMADPGLLGSGDCSSTLQDQFSQGGAAFDYTELRLIGIVPPDVDSLGYDFAFFSAEYPYYFGGVFNDMFVAWIESETWTGNTAFDTAGNPVSLNAGFLDYRDDGGADVPEFDGTCMKRHAGTAWLSTSAPVTPGEDITLVFAIFDLADPIVDSYAFIDNVHWGCDDPDGPITTPAD